MVLKLPEANLVTNLLLIDDIILMLHKVKNENFNFITKQVGFQTKYICFSCKNLTNITRNNNNIWIWDYSTMLKQKDFYHFEIIDTFFNCNLPVSSWSCSIFMASWVHIIKMQWICFPRIHPFKFLSYGVSKDFFLLKNIFWYPTLKRKF